MNKKIKINSNIKLSPIYGSPMLRKHKNKGIIIFFVENIIQMFKEIESERKKHVSRKNSNQNLQTIIDLSDMIVKSNQSQLNELNKNKMNLNLSNLENFKDLNNELTNTKLNELNELNESNSILMDEQQYIKLLSPFNYKLASETNQIYTFTNRPYKQINKNLNNIYKICESAFLNMSSLISKPIILINPNLIKIILFFYWKPLRKIYNSSEKHSKFLIFYYNKLEILVKLLSKLFKKSVELELIRIYSPQNESNILANLIGILSLFIQIRKIHMKLFKVSKTKNLNKGINNRFSNNKIPSFISGIYLKLAGRVTTQNLQRRVKSKIIQKGSLARTRARLINTNSFVNKNKRGIFSITIKTGHIIND